MKISRRLKLSGVALALAVSCAAPAAQLGDAAAPLKIAHWIKGKAVDLKESKGKNICVVEFWATWCGPCRVSIPHLNEMQKKFKDQGVLFVGVSDETVDKVKPFVEKMGEKMDYVVAIDDGGKTSAAYMEAFDQHGIPHAFVVNKDGVIAWHGHPMAGLDKALEQMLAGKFDLGAAKKAAAAEQLVQEYFKMVSAREKDSKADEIGKQIVTDATKNPEMLNQLAWVILTHPRVKHRDLNLALRAARTAYDATDGKEASITDTYARALFDTGKVEEAIQMQKKAIELCQDDRLRAELEKNLQRYEKNEKD